MYRVTILNAFFAVVAFSFAYAWWAERTSNEHVESQLKTRIERLECKLGVRKPGAYVRAKSVDRLQKIATMEDVETLIYALSDPLKFTRLTARDTLREICEDPSCPKRLPDDEFPIEREQWTEWAITNGHFQPFESDEDFIKLVHLLNTRAKENNAR